MQRGDRLLTKLEYEEAKRVFYASTAPKERRLHLTMALYCLKEDAIAALQTRTILAYDFSGKFHISKKHELAKLLNINVNNVYARLKRAVKLNLVEKRENGWYYAVGYARFNDAMGVKRFNMVVVEERVLMDKKLLRNFVYSQRFDRAAKRLLKKEKRKMLHAAKSHTKGASVPLGCGYLGNFIDCSKSTAWRHRTLAKENKFIIVKENVIVLGEGGEAFRRKVLDELPGRIDKAIRDGDARTLRDISRQKVRVRKYFCKKKKDFVPIGEKGELVYEHVHFMPSLVSSNLEVFSRKTGKKDPQNALCPFSFVSFKPYAYYNYSNNYI